MSSHPFLHWRYTRSGLGALVAAVLLSAPALAQEFPTPPQQELPDSVQRLLEEFREAEERFNLLQDRAMQENPELQERQVELGEMVREAVVEINPEAQAQMERLEALEGEFMAAQQRGDGEAVQALIQEAQQLQSAIESAQAQAFDRDEIREAVDTFQADLMVAMTELDPEAESMLERLQHLADRIMAQQTPGRS
jgi:DNA repair exonuclease SbcCD ATPase subunit